MKIDPKKLSQILFDKQGQESADRFVRIKRVYDQLFQGSLSDHVNFASFTVQDIIDTLDDLSDYTTEDNMPNSTNPDNTGVVLHEMENVVDLKSALANLTPAKIALEFF